MKKSLLLGALSASFILASVAPVVHAEDNATSAVASEKQSTSIVTSFTAVNGLNSQSILGADFSHYQQDLGWGKKYYNYKQEEVNPFDFVKSQGINTVSVKVAVNPDTSNDDTAAYTLDSAVKTLKAAKAAGLKTNVVLFFSDKVTYANDQSLPAGWTAENAADKALEYTRATLKTLSDNGALPTMVTLGNEVNYNFLNLSADGGWNGFVALANLSQVVKDAGSKVALSVAAPDDATGIQWVLQKYEDAKVNYDYIGVNLYADRVDINNYVSTLRQTVEEKVPGKQAYVSNIRFARQSADNTASANSQAQSIYNLLKATTSAANAGGLVYEDAEFVGSWYGFFDENGVAQPSLATFAYALGNPVDISGKSKDDNTSTQPEKRDPYQYGDDTGLKEQKVTVNKVPNMSESTIRGMDIGSYLALKRAGVKFYDFDGNEQPLMKILKDNGVNYIRLRIWNDPKNAQGETYGGGDNSVETSLEIAKEAASYGLPVQVNFHYSDFWVDPAKQVLPKAWAADAYDPDKMVQNIYDFTKETLQKFVDAGVNVGMVQVGNEITKGMAGIYNSRNNPNAPLVWNDPEQSATLDRYLNSGVKAAREVTPNALVALQLETPNPDVFKTIMDAWDRGNVDYDVLGSSSYPHWGNTMENTAAVQKLAADHGKLFAVMETSWLNSYMDGDGTPNAVGADYKLKQYEIGPQGQVDELYDMYKTVMSQPNGLGVFYWEPAWIPVKAGWNNWKYNKEIADIYGTGWASKGANGYAPEDEMWYQGKPSWGGSSWDNMGLFDISGYALQSLKFYTESISQGPVQTTQVKLVDADGEVLKTLFVRVKVGENTSIDLPFIWGHQAPSKTLTIQGQVSGVKELSVTYQATEQPNLVQRDGEWYLVQDGQVVPETTLAQVNGEGTWYYVKDGKLDWTFTGLVDYYGTTYYIQGGRLNWDYTGLVQDQNGVWNYVQGGRVDKTYNNLVQYNGNWYYVQNGQIDWSVDTLSQVDGNGTWYKVTNAQVDWTFTGLVDYYGTVYYLQNGRLDWNYNGLVQDKDGVWNYVQGGRVNKSYNNLVQYNGKWYYVQNGQIDWSVDTLSQVDGNGTWYKVTNAQVDWTFTGLVDYYGTVYYLQNGRLDWNYNGLVQDKDGVWNYVRNGRVDKDYTNLVQYNGNWYYVQNGRIDWSFQGLVTYNGREFYVSNAKIDWSFSGQYADRTIVNGQAQ